MKPSPRHLASSLAALLFAVSVQAADAPPVAKPIQTEPAKMNDADLKKKLTPMQYNVCMLSATEPAFRNEYWNHHDLGIYVDVISGEALFASAHKFDSGTGWPSFFQPLNKDAIVEIEDVSHGMRRVEVKAKKSNAHLGHVFDDGPKPGGQRYCINSASLSFVPVAKLQELGYSQFLPLFEKK